VNIHGHRVNNDRFEWSADGSEVVARHNPDFLLSSDSWFRGLELKYGPDGGVYLTDWSDIGECHENDADGSHRENGRIFKITYGDVKPVKVDLARQSDEELARLQTHANEWYVRTARRLLQDRAAEGKDLAAAHRVLRGILASDRDVRHRLRAIWALHATGGLDEKARLALLDDSRPQVRAWGVRLLVDDGPASAAALDRLAFLARPASATHGVSAGSPLVRMYLASAMQRIPEEKRWPVAAALAADMGPMTRDHELLIWYGLEPLVARYRDRAASMLKVCPNSMLCTFIARRLVAADVDAGLAAVMPALKSPPLEHHRSLPREVLEGVLEAVRGLKRARMPAGWPEVARMLAYRGDADVRAKAAALGLLFGDATAEAGLRSVVEDRSAAADARQFALQNLVDRRSSGLAPVLFGLLDDAALRGPAIRDLAAYNDPLTPQILLKRYGGLSPAERDDAIATLASRPAWAAALVDAIRSGVVARRDVTTTVARQILAFGDPKLATPCRRPTPTAAGRSSAGCAASATSSMARAATSAPTSPAPIGRTPTTSSRTCSTPAPAWAGTTL
jgi:hypothetical protein